MADINIKYKIDPKPLRAYRRELENILLLTEKLEEKGIEFKTIDKRSLWQRAKDFFKMGRKRTGCGGCK